MSEEKKPNQPTDESQPETEKEFVNSESETKSEIPDRRVFHCL